MNLACRGIRGATTVGDNTKDAIVAGTKELLNELIKANNIQQEQVATAIFTTTLDLHAEFPAVAARQIGWTDVALLCSHEMDVPDALPRCIRILLLVNTTRPPKEMSNIYLREAVNLRARGMESQ